MSLINSSNKFYKDLGKSLDYVNKKVKTFYSLFPEETSKHELKVLSVSEVVDGDVTSSGSYRYIVFFDDLSQDTVEKRSQDVLHNIGVNNDPIKILDQLNGFIVDITPAQADHLRVVSGVKIVESDKTLFIEPDPTSEFGIQSEINNSFLFSDNATNSTGEVVPWGVQAVWQKEDITKRGNFASDSYAFVIDSGVLNSTGDLNLASNSSWHRSWIAGENPFTDGNGHGTHVAGTIGALVNGKGIVGVAPGAQIISLKVFNSTGGGTSYSTIIEAVNHAASVINSNGLDKNKVVINMSLSGGFSPALDTAIKNAADQGIRFAIAAGNSGQDADSYSPASAGDHPNVFTVSAVDSDLRMPFWSNWDRIDSSDNVDDVDFAAPGVGVLSYFKNGQLAYLSGTSMAAPHVAGLLISGGVQGGTYATPNASGTSDPFAISSTQTVIPLRLPPSYYISRNSNTEEGNSFNIDVTTTNLEQGTSLYWKISGRNINVNDFVGLSELQGTIQTNINGIANLNFRINEDKSTEDNEVFTFDLFSDSSRSIKVGTRSTTVQDISKTPIIVKPAPIQGLNLWGTATNDIITGTIGNDFITGVMSNGTSAASMGVGQIDVLTGGSGADVFVLGDSRGVFYDDGIINNLGTSDYALIKDFKIGEDKLQLKKGNGCVFDVSNGNLSLYWDRNRNGGLETSGPNRDELIAVLEGVSTIGNSDLLMVR